MITAVQGMKTQMSCSSVSAAWAVEDRGLFVCLCLLFALLLSMVVSVDGFVKNIEITVFIDLGVNTISSSDQRL